MQQLIVLMWMVQLMRTLQLSSNVITRQSELTYTPLEPCSHQKNRNTIINTCQTLVTILSDLCNTINRTCYAINHNCYSHEKSCVLIELTLELEDPTTSMMAVMPSATNVLRLLTLTVSIILMMPSLQPVFGCHVPCQIILSFR